MQAAVGVAQLRKLPAFIDLRKKNFKRLFNALEKNSRYMILPGSLTDAEPSWFGFPLLIREDAPFSRSDLVKYLEDHKIATRVLFGGNLIKQPAYANTNYRVSNNLKNTDNVMSNLFWIGVYPGLTDQMLDYIITTFNRFFERFV